MQSLVMLNNLIEDAGWRSVPDEITSREGHKIATGLDKWILPISRRMSATNFERVKNPYLKWAIKVFVIHKIETVSSMSGYKAWAGISARILSMQNAFDIIENTPIFDFKNKLISLMEKQISEARKKQKLWIMYEVIQWYVWCANNYTEIGFCTEYALELDCMKIPGGPKGEPVRSGNGSLHLSLELPLLIKALKNDKTRSYHYLQEKAAMALSIAFGRNAANLTYLMESDFEDIAKGAKTPCYVIRMPRIKKRLNDPRDDFKEEPLSEEYALIIKELIEANKKHYPHLFVNTPNGKIEIERPIFINEKKNNASIRSGLYQYAYSNYSQQQTKLIQDFVKRHRIISPITERPLDITTRRLRYTLATGLAAEGISKAELARILDHTDTQHVHVYYDVRGAIVKHLTKAAAKGYSDYLDFFRGKVIDNTEEAVNGGRGDKHLFFVNDNDPSDQPEIGVCGESKICHLDPPYSCYLCPKFQPYRHADHDHVLECLLNGREERIEKYDSMRLGIQLDDVISAVAQVVKICEKGMVENV